MKQTDRTGTQTTTGTDALPHWLTVEEASDRMFTWFDGDEDGTIAVSEIVAVLDPGGKHAEQLNGVVRRLVDLMDADDDGDLAEADVTAALESLDTNGDGSLTPADLGPELAHQGLAPVLAVMLQGTPLPGTGPGREPPAHQQGIEIDAAVESLLGRFDGNDDGALSLAELLAVLDPQGHRQRLEDALTPLVAAVDADGDGVMSSAELEAGVASLDADGNGRLNHDDHVPGPHSPDEVDLIGVLLPKFRHFGAPADDGSSQ